MNYIIVNDQNEWITTGNTDVESPEEAIKIWLESHPRPHWTEFYVYWLKGEKETPGRTIVNPINEKQ